MRKEFFDTIKELAVKDKKIVFLTGDVGYNAIEPLQEAIGDRVINCGVAEANMVSMAAAMASQGMKPIVYSIAPFVTHRVAEQLKIDVCLHNMNVKIVGNGGGYGYGIMGATHHAIEDIALMSSLQNMTCYIPYNNNDTVNITYHMMSKKGPAYLRLGYSDMSQIWTGYEQVRKVDAGDKATIIGMGPVLSNALGLRCDVFAVNQIPFKFSASLIDSIDRTRRIIVIEEHVKRGGLGEYIAYERLQWLQPIFVSHLYAHGYPNEKYGSQEYHQKLNKLDANTIKEFIHGK